MSQDANSNDDAKLLGVLKASLISKACWGRYSNINRTLREIASISEAQLDSESKEDTTMSKLLKIVGTGQDQSNANTRDIKALSKAVNSIADNLAKK